MALTILGNVHDLAFGLVTDGVDFNPGQHSRMNSNIPGTFCVDYERILNPYICVYIYAV